MQTFTRSYCRTEQREQRFRFAGYATTSSSDTIRPRAYYQSCCNCTLNILTLGDYYDVPDALGLCRAVLTNWLRRKLRDEGDLTGGIRHRATATGVPVVSAATRFDPENVLGELFAHIWHLYNRWNPRYGEGSGTFRGYATSILGKKINTFIARDTGDAAGSRIIPKAHARSVSVSYEGIIEANEAERDTGGLDVALGTRAMDMATDHPPGTSWVHALGDSPDTQHGREHHRPPENTAAPRHPQPAMTPPETYGTPAATPPTR